MTPNMQVILQILLAVTLLIVGLAMFVLLIVEPKKRDILKGVTATTLVIIAVLMNINANGKYTIIHQNETAEREAIVTDAIIAETHNTNATITQRDNDEFNFYTVESGNKTYHVYMQKNNKTTLEIKDIVLQK